MWCFFERKFCRSFHDAYLLFLRNAFHFVHRSCFSYFRTQWGRESALWTIIIPRKRSSFYLHLWLSVETQCHPLSSCVVSVLQGNRLLRLDLNFPSIWNSYCLNNDSWIACRDSGHQDALSVNFMLRSKPYVPLMISNSNCIIIIRLRTLFCAAA